MCAHVIDGGQIVLTPKQHNEISSNEPYTINLDHDDQHYRRPSNVNNSVHGAWDSGFFYCHESPQTCCMATLCPCITAAEIGARIAGGHFHWMSLFFVGGVVLQLIFDGVAFYQEEDVNSYANINIYWFLATISRQFSHDMSSYTYFGSVFLLLFLLSVFLLRWTARRQFDIKGSIFLDFFLSVLFSWCSLAQMARQVRYEGVKAVDILPAYPKH